MRCKLGEAIKEINKGTRFLFKEVSVRRIKNISLIGESATEVSLDQTANDLDINFMHSAILSSTRNRLKSAINLLYHLMVFLCESHKGKKTKFVTDHMHLLGSQATIVGIVETDYKNGAMTVIKKCSGILATNSRCNMLCGVLLLWTSGKCRHICEMQLLKHD